MENITKICRDSVSELVYNQLLDKIIKGDWVPGDKIPSEHQLASLFGISRVSVRVALKKMITLGLLEAKVGEGTYVKEFTPGAYLRELVPIIMQPKNQIEILEFRKALESEVIRLAVERTSDEEIQKLEGTYLQMCLASEKSDLEEYFYLDIQFHKCLFDMSKNSMFISIFDNLRDLLFVHYQLTVKESWEVDGIPKAIEDDEHFNIVQGLKNRDAALALKAYLAMINAKLAMFSKKNNQL
ncbi:FadR/GntR family transcriptional regulator [Candidatus Desulfosporosinus nitrosoreducens]|uniref:FadR/GntR family transcriptional regulator n=1 Tax=Candidatus Desulfosporosinus nitrosoreducens TaxID=3401928 RepID=UPI00280B8F38|nr:FCD domain-containing protein [Desulfosporosinus sp. PR]